MNEEIEKSNEVQLQEMKRLREKRAFIEQWRNKQIEQMFEYPSILPESQNEQ